MSSSSLSTTILLSDWLAEHRKRPVDGARVREAVLSLWNMRFMSNMGALTTKNVVVHVIDDVVFRASLVDESGGLDPHWLTQQLGYLMCTVVAPTLDIQSPKSWILHRHRFHRDLIALCDRLIMDPASVEDSNVVLVPCNTAAFSLVRQPNPYVVRMAKSMMYFTISIMAVFMCASTAMYWTQQQQHRHVETSCVDNSEIYHRNRINSLETQHINERMMSLNLISTLKGERDTLYSQLQECGNLRLQDADVIKGLKDSLAHVRMAANQKHEQHRIVVGVMQDDHQVSLICRFVFVLFCCF
jgi:hypothetical protein